jgi:hypothetical protein
MIKTVPVVRVRIVNNLNPHPGFRTMGAPPGLVALSSNMAIAEDWIEQIRIVPYRVYWVIFFLPSSPSLESLSK